MSTCPGIKVDQDVAGGGVRTAFYVQSFCTVLAASIPGADVKGAYWTLTATSLAVLTYTLVQAYMETLTLHNAILVSYFALLNFMASLSVFFLIPTPFHGQLLSHNYRKMYKQISDEPSEAGFGLNFAMTVYYKPISLPLYMQYMAVFIYSFYIWSSAKTFGNQPNCNTATQLILFGSPFSAVGSGRVIALFFLSILVSLVAVPSLLMIVRVAAQVIQVGSFEIWSRISKPQPGRSMGVHTIPIDAAFLYYWLYTVIAVEGTVRQAAIIHGPVQWTFRQIFPLVSIIAPVSSVYYAAKKYLAGRVTKQLQEPPSPPSTDSIELDNK